MCQMVELYEEGVIKLKRRLHELIQGSDGPLTLNINWEDAEILGPHSTGNFEAPLAFFLCGLSALVFTEPFSSCIVFVSCCCLFFPGDIDVPIILSCAEDKGGRMPWTQGETLVLFCMSCCWKNESPCNLPFLSFCFVFVTGFRVLNGPSALRRAEWLVGIIPTWETDISCVRRVAKPKRRRIAAQIFVIWYWPQHSLRFYYDQKLILFVELRDTFGQ